MRQIELLIKRLVVNLCNRRTTESASGINEICTAGSEREQWYRGSFCRDCEIRRQRLEFKAQARFPPMGPGQTEVRQPPLDPPTLPATTPSCIGSHSRRDDPWAGTLP